MDNIDDSENNAKVSDSAYSNSCSNSQSRRSHSSKSTHSGSNSSGSSGYGGKPSASSSSNNLSQPSKKDKDAKKKKLASTETMVPSIPEADVRPADAAPVCPPSEEIKDVVVAPAPVHAQPDSCVNNMDTTMLAAPALSIKEEVVLATTPLLHPPTTFVTSRPTPYSTTGFSCVISMHDGIVMYTTSSLTNSLGFPKDMWVGRSFIDFVHPKDRNTFASQIIGLAVPKIVNGVQEKGQSSESTASTMACRIRRYRGLSTGYFVKDRVVTFMPFLLKFTFKNISDEDRNDIYLVIKASPLISAFKIPNEVLAKAVPFVIRHTPNGNLEYIDPESVHYLGYLPQDVTDKDVLQLYHPEDLEYLQEVYETIVKEGAVPRGKSYRMLAQNGHYLRLETEWSSFINPWSKRLEFVIGKHHIMEGPANPDVFQSPEPEKTDSTNDADKAKAQKLRANIIKILNEVLTKPAEIAKQQRSKRRQDLANFMESLIEYQQPKVDEELRLEIQDTDHYYERDSVMLGGISPHHDYDSKSSIGTPLSYTQLNYNDTLQRYFDSHIPYLYEDTNADSRDNVLGTMETQPNASSSSCLSPSHQMTADPNEQSSTGESSAVNVGNAVVALGEYQPQRLTESLLTKHNAEMEKDFLKTYRENRSSGKGEREKATNMSRQKKKEHLARCNATFQPTLEVMPSIDNVYKKAHGVKRTSKDVESEAANKHHCPSSQLRSNQTTRSAPAPSSSTITTTIAASQWQTNPVNNMNTFLLGVGVPQQMSVVSPVPTIPGMFQMYYTPASSATMPTSSDCNIQQEPSVPIPPQFQMPMSCMMYGQPMYGPPIIYSPINPQLTYPAQQSPMAQNMQCSSLNPLCLTNNNYEEACRLTFTPKPSAVRRNKKRVEKRTNKTDNGTAESSSCSTNAPKRSTDAVSDTTPLREPKPHPRAQGNSEETVDRTDGESSYSSFYSSFFKTESGSAEDSDTKKNGAQNAAKANAVRRKMQPPWMEQVCVTSELIYKYQITTKPKEDVLKEDQERLAQFSQPSLVNEQLGQLYLDLQLEGVAARLTLEEGITSSSSSGEDVATSTKAKRLQKKREYSKLVMIYEEDAPIPPPSDDAGSASSRSMT